MQLCTVPGDYIINMAHEAHGKVESNFLLHGLIIRNDTDAPMTLTQIDMEMHAGDAFVKQVTYRGKALQHAVARFARDCTWLGEGFGAQLYLGREGFWNPARYGDSVELAPGWETGLHNEYFVVVHTEKLDRICLSVTYESNGIEQRTEMSLPLVEYENRNSYIFPLKGCYSTCGNYNALLDHRQHYSMEFAIDMAQYNESHKLFFKEPMHTEDHIIYGREILAIADGVVADCFGTIPVTTSWVWEERKPYFEQYGLAAQFGNHVIIEHANGESSFYGHMIMDSLTVAKGDAVKQGQVIGRVGHTGLSNCPHLHFQLMDKPDILTGRGLPCSFTNLRDVTNEPMERIVEDNLIVHAVYPFTPPSVNPLTK